MNAVTTINPPRQKLLERLAGKYHIEPNKVLATLTTTAFRGDATTEQLVALCVVADQYNLNPWTNEIYAFPSRKGIVPVVGVDGWARIINEHPQFDGLDFAEAEDGSWVECTIHRKDRSHPVKVREWMVECSRGTEPWKTHPRRMLRHKALIQCARIAFAFVGIYDQDEAERIIDVSPEKVSMLANPRDGMETANPESVDAYVSRIADVMAMDAPGQDDLEAAQADALFAIHQEINPQPELCTAVRDACKARGVITAANYDKTVRLGSKRFQERK
jgi:phage recombination protein Bet